MLTHPNTSLHKEVTASNCCGECASSSELDTITDIVVKIKKTSLWELQSVSSSLLGGREGQCGKFIVNPSGNVVVTSVKNGDHERVGYHGLGRCGCVWTCPTCSFKILQRRKKQIDRILKNSLADGAKVGFLTLTVPHHAFQSAKELKDLVSSTYREIRQSRKYRRMIRTIEDEDSGSGSQMELKLSKRGRKRSIPKVILPEFLGDIRSLEVTHGKNGWHPHLHILLFAKCSDIQLQVFAEEIYRLWASKIEKKGYGKCSDKAYDFQPVTDTSKVAEYVAKWDIARELAGDISKSSKGRNSSEILADIYHEVGNVAQDKALYLAFADAFKGSQKITFSGGIKDRYLVLDQEVIDATKDDQERLKILREEMALCDYKTDEEIVNEKHSGEVIAEISNPVWSEMIRKDVRELTRDHFEAGGIEEAVLVLNALGVRCRCLGNLIVPLKQKIHGKFKTESVD